MRQSGSAAALTRLKDQTADHHCDDDGERDQDQHYPSEWSSRSRRPVMLNLMRDGLACVGLKVGKSLIDQLSPDSGGRIRRPTLNYRRLPVDLIIKIPFCHFEVPRPSIGVNGLILRPAPEGARGECD